MSLLFVFSTFIGTGNILTPPKAAYNCSSFPRSQSL